MATKGSKNKTRDLRHPITYKRENGKFDVQWYLNHDKREWVLPKVLKNQAKKLGKKPFLQFGYNKPISFYQTNQLANKVANGLLEMGIKKGDKVAVYMPNSDDYVITWFGILKMGAVMVPVNTGYKMDFLQYIIDSSDSIVLFIAEEYLERMPPIAKKIPQLKNVIVWTRDGSQKYNKHGYNFKKMTSYSQFIAPQKTAEPKVDITFVDHARLMYTSGTTGRSKGVVRPCAADYSSARNYAEIMDVGPDDVCFTCLPLFHSNAMVMTVYPALIMGAKAVVEEKYSASKFWKWMVDHGVTKFNLVGTISYFMWNTPAVPEEKQHKVKLVLGSPAPHDIIKEFMKRFNFKFMEGYGLTEIGQCTWMRPGEVFRVGSCGKEAPGYEIKIGDPETDEEVARGEIGEIIVRPRTPNVMLHYYNKMPEKTVEDFRNFWFHTGDAGRMDKDGYIYFVDRVKDYLRCKGENISSFEVEKVVGSHPDVEESGAIGVKAESGRYAEDELMIVVVPKKGKTIDPVKLIKFLEPKMPYFMIPRFIRFEKSLPKTGTLRVQKNKLRDKGITKDTWDMKKAGYKIKR
ncbi:MAG: AMP-binding protein [Deltaproteobacteria bacterium]|nr:AMP-binding protein [Deltaproteobacteria bacterium]